jgi:murein L,D-transpeptidase YafK
MNNIKSTKFGVLSLLLTIVATTCGLSASKIYAQQANPISVFRSDYDFLNTLWSHNEDGTVKNKSSFEYLLSPYIFVVDKKHSKMHLYFYNGQTYYIKSYNVLTGKNHGDKSKAGDLRTPEGIYFFKKYIPGSSLDKKYGNFAITMNFPNQIDKIGDKNGHGIWLHGIDESENAEKKEDTEGCIAAANIDLENIKKFIQPELTPVIIFDSFIEDPKRYSANPPKNLNLMINTWLESWNNKDLETYMSKYSDNFLDLQNKRDKNAWREYKGFLNKKYSSIDVKAKNISIYSHPRYSIVQFVQEYKSSSYSSKSLKRLYIELKDGNYYIISEKSLDLSSTRAI